MGEDIHHLTRDILEHPQFLKLKTFHHHGENNSVYDHSVRVAQRTYELARRHGMPEEEVRLAVRAALLHDFFGYNRYSDRFQQSKSVNKQVRRLNRRHFLDHGRIAANRAMRVFGLTQEQYDAIARHMFPLTAMPRTKMAWLITLADKQVAVGEMLTATRERTYAFYLRRRARRKTA